MQWCACTPLGDPGLTDAKGPQCKLCTNHPNPYPPKSILPITQEAWIRNSSSAGSTAVSNRPQLAPRNEKLCVLWPQAPTHAAVIVKALETRLRQRDISMHMCQPKDPICRLQTTPACTRQPTDLWTHRLVRHALRSEKLWDPPMCTECQQRYHTYQQRTAKSPGSICPPITNM
jgi:hypothetical protein